MALSVFQGEAKTGYRLLFMTSTTRKHAFVFDVRLSAAAYFRNARIDPTTIAIQGFSFKFSHLKR